MSTQPSALSQTLGDKFSQAADDVQASSQPQAPAPQPTPAPQPSRLTSTLAAIVSAANTGLASIPAQGRPGFLNGVTNGARGAQQAEANQQAIRFKTFDDQMRAAQLHNQDIALQNQTQEQQDAHEDHINKMHANDGDWGVKYDVIANHGDAVMDHLTTQTSANGAAVVPPGTHFSADGQTILIPRDTPETAAGQLAQFKAVAPALGLNVSIPDGATKLDPKVATVFYNKLQGFDPNGDVYTADKLPALIASNQAQRAELAKKGGPQVQLDALDGIISKQKAQLKADNDAADTAAQKNLSRQKQLIEAKGDEQKDVNAAKPQKGNDTTELNAVAYDPNYQNPDGSKGGNVVMSKSDAAAKGLTHYKADPAKLNALVAGFNDVQNKLNMLADVASDPKRMGAVQPQVAADMLRHGHGIELGAFGTKLDTSTIDADLARADSRMANQATKDYVTAMLGAHEAVTQLPRLQTFGQSSRMTQQQMDAAQRLLPQPGDGADLAKQKMTSLQGMLDPLRKQVPHMPGAESMPSWLEKQKAAPPAFSRSNFGGSNLANLIGGGSK